MPAGPVVSVRAGVIESVAALPVRTVPRHRIKNCARQLIKRPVLPGLAAAALVFSAVAIPRLVSVHSDNEDNHCA
jgi:hypothetical protein